MVWVEGWVVAVSSKALRAISCVAVCSIVAGCSGLESFRPSLPARLLVKQSDQSQLPQLADPSEQRLKIAWETARLAEQRGMDQEAIEAYLTVREHEPSRVGVAHALAVLYDRSGMTDAAEREYQAALSETPDDADVHCDYGYFLYSNGRLEPAEANLREALRLQPTHRQATVNLALVLGHRGRYEEAGELFTAAIGPAAAMHNVGMLKLQAGDVAAAQEMLAEAKRRDPSIQQGQPVLERLARIEAAPNSNRVSAAESPTKR